MSVEDLNDFIVTLQKSGMSPNTVLPNVIIIIAQFCKGNGRSGITRQVQLPERISSLPREYSSGGTCQIAGIECDAPTSAAES